jgi:uncharacterized peroxidase-related enzyme
MARISPLSVEASSPEAQAILKEIESSFGMVPNLFRTLAHYPPLLELNWNRVKTLMMSGSLSRKVKETIAVLVSKDNSCNYCVTAHTMFLQAIGVPEDEVFTIKEDIEKASFTDKEKALISFARKANASPLEVTDAEIDRVRESGASEAEILEALGVMELFTGFNKILDALQVEIDFA